jgi:PAS domain S-box-containing protein
MSPRWYERIDVSTAIISAVVLLLYVVFNFGIEPPGGRQAWGIFLPTAIAALVHVLYAVFIFPIIEKTRPRIAGLISFILFAVMAGSLVHMSRNQDAQYLSLWNIVIFLAGMFGWMILSITTLLTLIYYALISAGIVVTGNEVNDAHFIILLLTSALSYVLWRNVSIDPASYGANKNGGVIERVNSDVLINSIVDGVMLVGSDGIIKIFNPSAITITGWNADEAIGLDYRSVLNFFDDKGMELGASQNPITTCFQTAKPVKRPNIIIKTHDGKNLELDLMASPIITDKSSAMAVMVIFRDVSQERGEERQRAEFISTASHEMRTPVAAIEGYLALAMNAKVAQIDPVARGYLEKAHDSAKQLGKLFQDLLTAAKSEDGRLSSHPVPVEVGVFLRDITERARFAADKKGLLLRYKLAPNSESTIDTTKAEAINKVVEPIYYVHADPDRLREVITNIIDNAIKYTEEGTITVAMSASQGSVIISIADTGPGISKDDLPHLFQKFYRIDNSNTRQVGGTGLGLFICQKIVELYGGKIWADSVVGKGSVFNISLPQLESATAKELIQKEAATRSPLDDAPEIPTITQT